MMLRLIGAPPGRFVDVPLKGSTIYPEPLDEWGYCVRIDTPGPHTYRVGGPWNESKAQRYATHLAMRANHPSGD